MSYKTNPIINRVKHTLGWQPLVKSSAPEKFLVQSNTFNYKTFIFLKSWFKLRSWILLNIQQISTNKTKIWFITAMRVPKKKQKRNKPIKNFYADDLVGCAAKKMLNYKKRFSFITKHFQKRKKMFNFIHLYKKTAHLKKKNCWQWKKNTVKNLISNNILQKQKNTKLLPWLGLLTNVTQNNAFLVTEKTRFDIKDKLQSAGLTHFKSSLRAKFFWPTRKWKNYKKTDKTPKEQFLLSWNFNKKKSKKQLQTFKKYFCSSKNKINKIAYLAVLRKKIICTRIYTRFLKILAMLYLKNGNKNIMHKRSYAFCIKLTKSNIQQEQTNWEKTLVNVKKNFEQNYSKLADLKLNFIKTKKKKLISRVIFFHKKRFHLLNRKKAIAGNVYLFWKEMYIKKLLSKQVNVVKILQLFKSVKHQKYLVKPNYKSWFLTKKIKRLHLHKNPLFLQGDRKIAWFYDKKENNKANRTSLLFRRRMLRKKNKKKSVFKWIPSRLLTASKDVKLGHSWEEYNWNFSKLATIKRVMTFHRKRQLKKNNINKQNLKLSSFRINFLFKKIVLHFLPETRNGNIVVKFLQPTGSLLSMKKLRSMASKITSLKMYKKQKLYRRFTRTLLLFFRYLHPQPIVEQIAFELEKTKKHWPILKAIRVIMQKLNSGCFQGYRILIRGKINSCDRTRDFFIRYGHDIPTSTFNSRMLYAIWHSLARTGNFGVRAWIYLPPHEKTKQ